MKTLLVSMNAKFIHSSLALRSIKTYCKAYEEQLEILELTINHDENQLIQAIYKKSPQIIGFSCYIWNMGVIQKLIPNLRKIMPDVTIVLGGPEVSYENHVFLETLPIDLIMEGEGEYTWKAYLDYRIKNIGTLESIPGLVYNLDGQIKHTGPAKLIPLDEIPFVYDTLEDLTHRIIYYEASRGCPFNCQYCLSSVEKGVRFLSLDRVKKELQYFLDQKVPQVKFVDRTFNASKKYAMEIWNFIIKQDNGITNFHFEIAAERLDQEMIQMLSQARSGLIQFEIGVQSTNLKVLERIDRKMPFEEIANISTQIKETNVIHQHLDLIAGLPLEDYASFRKSFNDVISLRPEQFQLGFLKLLRGSGLRNNAEKYGIVYSEFPPYEVLYTKDISYNELLSLHLIEEMLERYYNTNRFTSSIEYLYEHFKTPFDCYEALAQYWEDHGLDQISHKKEAYYRHLAEFGATIESVNRDYLKELIRYDWYLHENVKEMPKALETIDQSLYKMLNNKFIRSDEKIEQLIGKTPKGTGRQRLRQMHIEYFQFLGRILFDYTEAKVKQYKISDSLWDMEEMHHD